MADAAPSAPPSTGAPTTGGYIPLPSAPVGGKRKMKKVSAKTIKRTLRKLGMKPKGRVVLKGGDDMGAPPAEQQMAGKRKTKKRSASRRKSIFGL